MRRLKPKWTCLIPQSESVSQRVLQGATILTSPQNETAVKSLLNACILEKPVTSAIMIQGPTADYKIAIKARMYLNRDVLRILTAICLRVSRARRDAVVD